MGYESAYQQAFNHAKENYFLSDEQIEEILENAQVCCTQEPCMSNTYGFIDEKGEADLDAKIEALDLTELAGYFGGEVILNDDNHRELAIRYLIEQEEKNEK